MAEARGRARQARRQERVRLVTVDLPKPPSLTSCSDSASHEGGAKGQKKQRIKFPRRYGHGGRLRLGARELGRSLRLSPRMRTRRLTSHAACLLRVVELVLDGLKGSVICTKRDMYYRDVRLFAKQHIVDSVRVSPRSSSSERA